MRAGQSGSIAALIWDAGGTLFDTYPAMVEACRSAAASFGVSTSSEWLRGLFRRSTDEALSVVSATHALDLAALNERYRAVYEGSGPTMQPPFPFAREVCTHMVMLGGSNFVVTHRGRASLEGLLVAHNMLELFSDMFTADDPYPRKPDPASILALLFRHRLDPCRCMIVGDRDLDLEAGARAGIRTCFFGVGGYTTYADLEVRGLDQLLHWLDGPGCRRRVCSWGSRHD